MSVSLSDCSDIVDRISVDELQEIARRPNGTNLVLDLVREGRVTAEDAVRAIDEVPRTRLSRFKSFLLTAAKVFFSR